MTGEELKDWRKSFRLSQRGLGRLLGCTGQTISNWESAAVHAPPWVEKHIHSIAYLQDTILEDIKQSRAVSVLEILGCSIRLEFDFEDSGADRGEIEGAEKIHPGLHVSKTCTSIYQQEKDHEVERKVAMLQRERMEKALR
jgi:transcriptional regulator with XRE-family HTH domain